MKTHSSCFHRLLTLNWRAVCAERQELVLLSYTSITNLRLFVCHPNSTGGYGSLQVPEEEGHQFILLWTSCKCLRALPRLQPQQGQWVNKYHMMCICANLVTWCEHIKILYFQCIVQSYLQWLQDSDYNPNCALCNNPLTAQDTVRLVCYGKIIKIISGNKWSPVTSKSSGI